MNEKRKVPYPVFLKTNVSEGFVGTGWGILVFGEVWVGDPSNIPWVGTLLPPLPHDPFCVVVHMRPCKMD
jgi:hypothetical protein